MSRLEGSLILTYRCNLRCRMCHIWQNPSDPREEISPRLLEKLPRLSFCNLTGGEPFLREDLEEILGIMDRKAERIVVSTNGYHTDAIVRLAEKYRNVGFRVSLEGFTERNDRLRGVAGGFRRGFDTVMRLKRMGLKDLGIAVTVSDGNHADLVSIFRLAEKMNLEFATAVVHNSYYFHKSDNRISRKSEVESAFNRLIDDLLKSRKIKNWYRAYFNHGLANLVRGGARLLPCRAGSDFFFLDPTGEIRPCNGMEESIWLDSFGNLKHDSFERIWHSPAAERIRNRVRRCEKQCWMIGSAGPAMKRHIHRPTAWVVKNKCLSILGWSRS